MQLECPVCDRKMLPPTKIYMCVEKHVICELCVTSMSHLRYCPSPKCMVELKEENLVRHSLAEDIVKNTVVKNKEQAQKRRVEDQLMRSIRDVRRRRLADEVRDEIHEFRTIGSSPSTFGPIERFFFPLSDGSEDISSSSSSSEDEYVLNVSVDIEDREDEALLGGLLGAIANSESGFGGNNDDTDSDTDDEEMTINFGSLFDDLD